MPPTLSLLSMDETYLLATFGVDLCQVCGLTQVNLFDDNQI